MVKNTDKASFPGANVLYLDSIFNKPGGSGSYDSITNNDIPPSDLWKTDSYYWKEYHPYLSQNKRKLSDQERQDRISQL